MTFGKNHLLKCLQRPVGDSDGGGDVEGGDSSTPLLTSTLASGCRILSSSPPRPSSRLLSPGGLALPRCTKALWL